MTVKRLVWKKRKAAYREYLKSKEWRAKRVLVFQRDESRCRDCGGAAEHVHHLTYERIFNEALEDLISLCSHCHNVRHGMSPNKRRKKKRTKKKRRKTVKAPPSKMVDPNSDTYGARLKRWKQQDTLTVVDLKRRLKSVRRKINVKGHKLPSRTFVRLTVEKAELEKAIATRSRLHQGR